MVDHTAASISGLDQLAGRRGSGDVADLVAVLGGVAQPGQPVALSCMHTGDRSAEAIDSGGVLPGYQSIIVRDGLYDFEPGKQERASQMASLLIEARDAAAAARQVGQSALGAAVLEGLAAAGLAASLYRRTASAKDARRIARRFLGFEDLILRFATRPDLDIFSNNDLAGQGPAAQLRRLLADPRRSRRIRSRPALPLHRHQMGYQQLDALRDLFSGHAWLPPGLEPAG